VRVFHPGIHTNVTCKQQGCKIIFQNIHQCYRHIIESHRLSLKQDDYFDRKQVVDTAPISDNIVVHQNSDNIVVHQNTDNIVVETHRNLKEIEFEFLSSLYKKPHLTRKDINDIVSNVRSFSQNIQELNVLNDDKIECFDKLETDYKRIKFFETSGIYVAPEEITFHSNSTITDNNIFNVQYIPLTKTLEILFNIPGILNEASNYMSIDNSSLTDIKNGNRYKSKFKDSLPFVLYYDDFETGNPLGSHRGKHKIGAVYMSLRCFPPHLYSRLSNIFLVYFLNSDARVKLGNARLFSRLIVDIEQNGLTVKDKLLKFCVFWDARG
jgi:hypothetical protein